VAGGRFLANPSPTRTNVAARHHPPEWKDAKNAHSYDRADTTENSPADASEGGVKEGAAEVPVRARASAVILEASDARVDARAARIDAARTSHVVA
jgi:hypothetical protein